MVAYLKKDFVGKFSGFTYALAGEKVIILNQNFYEAKVKVRNITFIVKLKELEKIKV